MSHDSTTASGRTGSLRVLAGASLAMLASLVGCASKPQSFATPEAAVGSFVSALRSDNQDELKKILGPSADEAISSGDDVADDNAREEFLRAYEQRNRLVPDGKGWMTLEVGTNLWPMAIPIVKGDNGWYFDTEEGLDELLTRRIGRNELYTIQVCLSVAEAQREYASKDYSGDGWREYAQHFRSEPGKRNGLFWPAAPGEPESPLGEFVAEAAEEGYGPGQKKVDGRMPFHGYYYRILNAQGPAAPGGAMSYLAKDRMIGGFGIVAWPAEYANSGLKTFIVSHHGIVYEKDLGDSTDRIARDMKAFDPGEGWTPSDTSTAPD
jgi:hypothetical protein